MAIYFLIFVLFVFLFVGGETQQKHRLIKDVWDAGHLVLFGLISFIYFSRPAKANHSIIYKIIVTTLFCLLVGSAIEVIQLFTHRNFSIGDIINDVIGGYLGLLAIIITSKHKTLKNQIIAPLVFFLLVIIGLRGLEKDLIDEYILRSDFPELASFETNLEMDRWEFKQVNAKRSLQHVKKGSYSLEAEFLPGRYPNISMQHFLADWSGYEKLGFSVFNPTNESQQFELKVYDARHVTTGRKYKDRLNKQITFAPGWNEIDIELSEIIRSPKHRSMNAKEIKGFSLFTDKLKQPVTLFIDNVHLK